MSDFVQFDEIPLDVQARIDAENAVVRAKYRCLSITHHLNGTTVEMKPVIGKCPAYPGGSEENLAYFKATPTGEAKLQYRVPPSEVPYKVGSYYHIALIQHTGKPIDRPWKLWKVDQTETAQTIGISLAWDSASMLASAEFTACIENQTAWHTFTGKAGTLWRVSFSTADNPPAGSATYP